MKILIFLLVMLGIIRTSGCHETYRVDFNEIPSGNCMAHYEPDIFRDHFNRVMKEVINESNSSQDILLEYALHDTTTFRDFLVYAHNLEVDLTRKQIIFQNRESFRITHLEENKTSSKKSLNKTIEHEDNHYSIAASMCIFLTNPDTDSC